MLSAQAMDLPLVKLLLKRGARVDVADGKGQSVLHWSVMSQGPWSAELMAASKEIIDLLVDANVSVLFQNTQSCCIVISFAQGYSDITQLS